MLRCELLLELLKQLGAPLYQFGVLGLQPRLFSLWLSSYFGDQGDLFPTNSGTYTQLGDAFHPIISLALVKNVRLDFLVVLINWVIRLVEVREDIQMSEDITDQIDCEVLALALG